MFPAVVKRVMKNGFNVINMKPTALGNLWKHGDDNDTQRLVLLSSVVKIPAPPQFHTLTRAGYVHYRIPEMDEHGWGTQDAIDG